MSKDDNDLKFDYNDLNPEVKLPILKEQQG